MLNEQATSGEVAGDSPGVIIIDRAPEARRPGRHQALSKNTIIIIADRFCSRRDEFSGITDLRSRRPTFQTAALGRLVLATVWYMNTGI